MDGKAPIWEELYKGANDYTKMGSSIRLLFSCYDKCFPVIRRKRKSRIK